jgi:hypothetical protein
MKLPFLLFPLLAIVALAEPSRDAGLSLHMLPDRVAKFGGEKGGFTATDPATRQRGKTYSNVDDLLVYIERLPAPVKENGVWIVYTHPDSYAPAEKKRLDELISKLKEKNIRVFTCRASELSSGAWKAETGIEENGAKQSLVSQADQEHSMKIVQGDLSAATNEVEKFYALNHAAKNALQAGNTVEAETLANELAQLALKYTDDWNYGNAIQDANQVLGRIALSKGDVAEAKMRLLASADSNGSPQMNSFGPNMRLAKALLEKGERDVVLDYFQRCGKFWKMGKDRLATWAAAVKKGDIPDFGPNLRY